MSWREAPAGLSQLFSTMTVNKQSTCYQLAQWLRLGERESRMGGTFCFREGHSSRICFRFTPCLPLLVCLSVWEQMCVCVGGGFVCWITILADLDLCSQRDAGDKEVHDGTDLLWKRLDFDTNHDLRRVCVCVFEKAEVCSRSIL